ncbi:helix-turn-helix transcriptional regulator [Streptomyces seoulensis]|uniref:helix-turn-helix transcriptional regulator n=1 Tax=Streptomyces seoulensis TaxID=73044 RepID=UPI0036679421
MTDYHAIDALLADARTPAALPPADRRRALREALHLTRTQVAHALGVSPSTVGGWETGRDPSGELREKYAYFLSAAQEKLRTQHTPPPHPEAEPTPADDDTPPTARPCVLCGAPATDEVEGYPQHLHPDDCTHPTPPHEPAASPPATTPTPPPATAPEPGPTALREPGPAAAPELRPTAAPEPGPAAAPAPQREAAREPGPEATAPPRPEPAPRRRAPQHPPRTPDLITRAVQDALAAHAGDLTAATAELQRRAIPDAMALLDATRIGARYDIVGHPPLPGILRKKSAQGADEVWEARPHWSRQDAPPAGGDITALDINGAYLSALKTHLPLGALEHSTGNVHSRRRAGIHLITPPDWDHHPCLPNPLGNREEPGPVWVTEPTLRLLQRLATAPYGPLCEPPVIHESFTSGATEQLFEKFRQALRDAREKAIADDDELTLEYVKSMYSKFVSTMGESNYNRALYRPDWMHIIRSQAFVNLWLKAHKAHTAGLTVMRVMGTDELHIAGNWQQVFTEGRGVSQVKVKDVYAAPGTGHR